MKALYRHALVRNTEQREAELKADYRNFAKERLADQIKALKTMFLGMLPALLVLLTVIGFVFFLSNKGGAA